jgi:hypothetical protein
LLSWGSAFLSDEEVGFFFYFQLSLKVNFLARGAKQSLAKINNRRGDHWSSFFVFSDETFGFPPLEPRGSYFVLSDKNPSAKTFGFASSPFRRAKTQNALSV